ncbi:cysteine hydrolase family protein [Desulfoplanes sp.]
MRQALLIIDMLNDFVLKEGPLYVPMAREIVPAVRQRLDQFRTRDNPVLFLCDQHEHDDKEFTQFGWPPHAVRGTSGARVVDELAPMPGDHFVPKQHYSAFYRTRLDEILRLVRAEELVLTGCVTNICILYTAADAVMRGYRVRVPESCVAALDEREGRFALEQMEGVLKAIVEWRG